MPDEQPKRYEARVVSISESGGAAFAEPWHDYWNVSIRAAAVSCFQANYGVSFGFKRIIEVREVGTDKIHRATVQPRIEYEVTFEERGDG